MGYTPRDLKELDTIEYIPENLAFAFITCLPHILIDSGCKWRQLPHDFPPAFTVHSFYRRARLSGLWDNILEHLVKVTREKEGRSANPTYALIDSQSVKTVYASKKRGYDGGKKQKDEKDI